MATTPGIPFGFDQRYLTPGFDYRNLLIATEQLDEQERLLDGIAQKTAEEKEKMLGTARSVAEKVWNYRGDFITHYGRDEFTTRDYWTALHNEIEPHCEALRRKIDHLEIKIQVLYEGLPSNQFTHQQFTTAAVYNTPQNYSTPTASSYSVAFASYSPTPAPTDSSGSSAITTMIVFSRLLRNGRESDVLKEFDKLPTQIQQDVYEALWRVKGKPMRDNFGEISFKNLDTTCFSTCWEKACAVELAKIPSMLHEIICAYKSNDPTFAYKIFKELPSQFQKEVFEKLEVGSNSQKADSVEAYLVDCKNKIIRIQDEVAQMQQNWAAIDKNTIRGHQKNDSKRESLDAFVKKTVPLFLADAVTSKPDTQGKNSYQSLAEAYATAYPFLRPFIFQLVPNLKIGNE